MGKNNITLTGNSLTEAAKAQASNVLNPENFMSRNRSLLYTNRRFYHSKPPRLSLASIKRVLTIFRLRPVFLSRCRFGYLHEPANVSVSECISVYQSVSACISVKHSIVLLIHLAYTMTPNCPHNISFSLSHEGAAVV